MKVLELFCGTKSISKAFAAKGHNVYSVDWDKRFCPSLTADIGTLTVDDVVALCNGLPDVVWASFDCTTFSIAAISHHRRKNPETGNLDPISDYARFCDKVDKHVISLIDELQKERERLGMIPALYFFENPRGGMRKMEWMADFPRYTVTYCQYGDFRQKPTDIWTNHPDPKFKPPCKRGASCHDAAPRGARTGTQALKNAIEKAKIPTLLCQHIVDICEESTT
jgi:hypothetical protein